MRSANLARLLKFVQRLLNDVAYSRPLALAEFLFSHDDTKKPADAYAPAGHEQPTQPTRAEACASLIYSGGEATESSQKS